MISHIVLMKFRNDDTAAQGRLFDQLEKFASGFPDLATGTVAATTKIPGIVVRGADAVMEMRFRSVDAFKAYLANEDHIAFRDDVLLPACEWTSVAQLEVDGD